VLVEKPPWGGFFVFDMTLLYGTPCRCIDVMELYGYLSRHDSRSGEFLSTKETRWPLSIRKSMG
jgi:hypothetical protein